jgi:fatty-acyl-CoA synthase
VPDCQVRIADPGGDQVASGQVGEVWIRGPQVMQGYWQNPEATATAFRDGWFRSGDAGFMDDDGYLCIVDRLKDIIIVGSSNVYPADLEAVLAESPAVAEAAVVARPDEALGEVPVACVVLCPEQSMTAEQVMALFRGRLAEYKCPRDVVFLDLLPRNALGKVKREELRLLVRSHWSSAPATLA